MSLKVKLKRYTGTEYSLTAEVIEHTMTRMPIQSALPNNNVLVLDLKMAMEQVSIRGTVDTTANKLLYRTAAIDWASDITDWTNGTDMIQLTLNSSETYYGVIKSFAFRQEAAKLDTVTDQGWEFDLMFLVKAKKV